MQSSKGKRVSFMNLELMFTLTRLKAEDITLLASSACLIYLGKERRSDYVSKIKCWIYSFRSLSKCIFANLAL